MDFYIKGWRDRGCSRNYYFTCEIAFTETTTVNPTTTAEQTTPTTTTVQPTTTQILTTDSPNRKYYIYMRRTFDC